MGVAAERLERHRVRGLAVGPDLEDVAVVLQPGAAVGLVLGLLARHPGAPRRRAAGAVGERAGDADPLAVVRAVPVDGDDRAAAGRADALVVHGAGDLRYAERGGGADLVVLDQRVLLTAGAEHRRTVVQFRRRVTTLQLGLAGLGDDRVLEARRQREDALRVVHQRRERPVRRERPRGRLRLGGRLGEGGHGADSGEPGTRGGSAPENGTAVEGHSGAPYNDGLSGPDPSPGPRLPGKQKLNSHRRP